MQAGSVKPTGVPVSEAGKRGGGVGVMVGMVAVGGMVVCAVLW